MDFSAKKSGTIPFTSEKELPEILRNLNQIFGFCDELYFAEENENIVNNAQVEEILMATNNSKSFCCEDCNATFNKKESLVQHIETIHIENHNEKQKSNRISERNTDRISKNACKTCFSIRCKC